MKLKFIVLLFSCFMIFSCAPSIYTNISIPKPALSENQNIAVYDEKDISPPNSKVLGIVVLGDSGFTTNCDFETMIEIAKSESRKAGGNAIKIIKHILPNFFGSSCHRIEANILEISEKNSIDLANNIDIDTVKKSKVNLNNSLISNTDKKLTRFVLSSSIGYGYRLAKLGPGFNRFQEDYFSGLKSGYNYDLSLYYRFKSTSSYGFGVKYNVFNASNSANNVSVTNLQTGFVKNGSISDDITFTFIGVSYIFDFRNPNSKHEFFSEFAFGLLDYNNNSKVVNENYKITGATFGSFIGLGYNYRASKNFSIGPQVNFINGNLSGFDSVGPDGIKKTIKLPKGTFESLVRIDVTFHCLYRF